MSYTYFPGCCMHGFARHCHDSLLAVFRFFNLELRELKDWNCCGATTYISVDEDQAFALAARNLALAAAQGEEIVAPCNACFMILKKAQDYLERFPALREKIQAGLKAIGLHYTNHLRILHPLEVLIRDLGTEKIRAAVRQPLAGCEVAPYYGCLLVRPYPLSPGITLESLDALIPALGARLADFDMKTHCCGGSLTGTIEEVGNRLVYILLRRAKHLGANVLVTVCPLCQLNLEVQQRALLREYREDVAVPVPYFTQLIGLALGLPESELGLHRLLVPLETNSLTQGRTAREHVAA